MSILIKGIMLSNLNWSFSRILSSLNSSENFNLDQIPIK